MAIDIKLWCYECDAVIVTNRVLCDTCRGNIKREGQ